MCLLCQQLGQAAQTLPPDSLPHTGPIQRGRWLFRGWQPLVHGFMGASPLGPQWLARACTVLFGWDTWFCKKLKKENVETPLCMCVPGKAGPGPPSVQPSHLLAVLPG